MVIHTETETVIKRILPYLNRRGYDILKDLDFETAATITNSYNKGFVDILVTLGKKRASFLIEAKRISKKLTNRDRDQAIAYARAKEINVPFVVVTNGTDIHCYNTKNKLRIMWDGKLLDKIPSKEQLPQVLRTLRVNPQETNIGISNDVSLPYRPGLPLRQLNALFYKGHSTIRTIEKNEEYAFSDFSKLLFLRLLEEKHDSDSSFELPYSYRFYELADTPASNADQVKDAIQTMIKKIIENTKYGEVLQEEIHLKNPKSFLSLVKDLASVSFCDCSVDSKGAAFEYYVRATLKGKKLGQYFTPRELVQIMNALVGEMKITNALLTGSEIKVLDPACGTGGFLVYLLQDTIAKLQNKLSSREINQTTYHELIERVKERVFYGSDANEGVAASAKMNMIIAGDGHTNIKHEDSLSAAATNWSIYTPDCNIIITNPPFGTSESASLTKEDRTQYAVPTTKGQYLFLQKMINTTIPGGEICTVIDEGLLNTETGAALRRYILQHCRIKAIINLPPETFKPNKINVRSSVIYMERRDVPDIDWEDHYTISFCRLDSLGYYGSGDKIRGFDLPKLLDEIAHSILNSSLGSPRKGYHWEAFDVDATIVGKSEYARLDYKYWDINVCKRLEDLLDKGNPTIKAINLIPTTRGISPTADSYVDMDEGYAIVIKAGSSISKFGNLILEDSDWIEKSLYEEYADKANQNGENLNLIKKYDVLLASTGDGTLGKACVYDADYPAIADGHVTIIRVDTQRVFPYYLADYIRYGFGAIQVNRLYTGSTGLIELTPEQVDRLVVELPNIDEQKCISKKIRAVEKEYMDKMNEAETLLNQISDIIH